MKVPGLCLAICCTILFFSVTLSEGDPQNTTENTQKNVKAKRSSDELIVEKENGTKKIESAKKKREVTADDKASCENTLEKEKAVILELLKIIEGFKNDLNSKKDVSGINTPSDSETIDEDDNDVSSITTPSDSETMTEDAIDVSSITTPSVSETMSEHDIDVTSVTTPGFFYETMSEDDIDNSRITTPSDSQTSGEDDDDDDYDYDDDDDDDFDSDFDDDFNDGLDFDFDFDHYFPDTAGQAQKYNKKYKEFNEDDISGGRMRFNNKGPYNNFSVIDRPFHFNNQRFPALPNFNVPGFKPFQPRIGRPNRGWKSMEISPSVNTNSPMILGGRRAQFPNFPRPRPTPQPRPRPRPTPQPRPQSRNIGNYPRFQQNRNPQRNSFARRFPLSQNAF